MMAHTNIGMYMLYFSCHSYVKSLSLSDIIQFFQLSSRQYHKIYMHCNMYLDSLCILDTLEFQRIWQKSAQSDCSPKLNGGQWVSNKAKDGFTICYTNQVSTKSILIRTNPYTIICFLEPHILLFRRPVNKENIPVNY